VLSKQVVPTVGYADEDVFVPQWAIAGIVIGLASLLFVIIFGVTVVSMLIRTVYNEQCCFHNLNSDTYTLFTLTVKQLFIVPHCIIFSHKYP
jgi:hypothetical protein